MWKGLSKRRISLSGILFPCLAKPFFALYTSSTTFSLEWRYSGEPLTYDWLQHPCTYTASDFLLLSIYPVGRALNDIKCTSQLGVSYLGGRNIVSLGVKRWNIQKFQTPPRGLAHWLMLSRSSHVSYFMFYSPFSLPWFSSATSGHSKVNA